jgi:hypothetical protein
VQEQSNRVSEGIILRLEQELERMKINLQQTKEKHTEQMGVAKRLTMERCEEMVSARLTGLKIAYEEETQHLAGLFEEMLK